MHFAHLIGIVLENNIPNHRPIFLLDHNVDYRHSSFRLFHSWFEMDRFDKVVRDCWSQVAEDNNPWVIYKKKITKP